MTDIKHIQILKAFPARPEHKTLQSTHVAFLEAADVYLKAAIPEKANSPEWRNVIIEGIDESTREIIELGIDSMKLGDLLSLMTIPNKEGSS